MPDEAGASIAQTEATPEQIAPTTETATEQVEQVTQAEQPKTFTQSELDALVQKRVAREQRRYNREIGELKGRLQGLETQRQPQPQAPKELRQEDFGSYDDFIEARAKKAALDAVSNFEAQRATHTRQSEEQNRLKELDRQFTESEDSARERFEDYDEVIDATVRPGMLKPQILEYFAEVENGAELLYHLANEPKELARIAKLSPTAAIRELTKRESLIEQTERRTSKAPPPTRPLPGSTAQPNSVPSERDDMETWIRKRRAQVYKPR